MKRVQQDQLEFQRRVIETYYDINDPPPIFIIAHSLGGAQMMNILMDEYDKTKDSNQLIKPLKYESVCLATPWLGAYADTQCKMTIPFLRVQYCFDNQAKFTVLDIEDPEFPEHIMHWIYDFDNPCQRYIMPLRTTLVLHENCLMHENTLKICKEINKNGDLNDNPYARIKTPIFFLLGTKDTTINNSRVKKIYK